MAPCHCLSQACGRFAAALLQQIATQNHGVVGKKGLGSSEGFQIFLHKWQKSGNSHFTAVCVMFVLHKSVSWRKERENTFTEGSLMLAVPKTALVKFVV